MTASLPAGFPSDVNFVPLRLSQAWLANMPLNLTIASVGPSGLRLALAG